ncbi:helix-turn-helix domain-containing protein [Pseudomonas sp. S37]|uniref:GlxA family transcriptional regulator n=1 Tax=unclassified Pseudomonas TaxID=196821 RepID=UPI0019116422|nr:MULTISPECIES: helix-turn-helix domain-containing protein [unclassified Pseudomonas]MBK4987686.1 helix-turn-helix domain-containing protein [Pseudomonas sp. S36]MBK4991867.1 helix-turn-helix domain-containing protein [Pseudomonas sp. S37]MBK5006353.1 helix-turn-helix domain-containing protein [Pseudomonas sp. S32]MBK5009482.1 helix-turn-helix domain-containing protein [Pseudomonas sp. S60]
MRLTDAPALHTVHIVIYPGFKSLEAVGALTVFDYANAHLTASGEPPLYDLHLVAPEAGSIQSDTLARLDAESLRSRILPNTALIVGARDITTAVHQHRPIVDWCRHAASRIDRLVGVCSGAFFLAQAGVLDGLDATTHWSVATRLATEFPEINVNADAIFIQNGRIWTCAGVSAAIDLSLALVEQDLGQDLALTIARELVVYLKRPGGQSQFSQHLGSQMTPHSGIRELQIWILQNLSRDLTLETLASQANMSTRNLRRVFQRQTESSPSEFIERARLERARRLLADEDVALKRIAAQCGFGSEEHMRRVFQRHLGVTPKAYRDQYEAH